MKFFVSRLSLAAAVVSFGALANAAAINVVRAAQDVYAPHITSPAASDVWKVGEEVTVTWDASSPPSQITNPNGYIMLRKGERTTPLYLKRGFQITDGQASFTVPDVVPGSDYSVVLFGDSGNFSDLFSIESDEPTPKVVANSV